MNLPNKLTVLRIILVPFFVLFLLTNFQFHNVVAFALFVIASITDSLDGKIARKRNLITDFGKFADPLADKILVISALVCFVELGIISSWLVIIVLFREFSVTSIRLVASAKGKVVAANIWGKAKTVSQMIAIILTIVLLACTDIVVMLNGNVESFVIISTAVSSISLWISTVLVIVSGIVYIIDNKEFIADC